MKTFLFILLFLIISCDNKIITKLDGEICKITYIKHYDYDQCQSNDRLISVFPHGVINIGDTVYITNKKPIYNDKKICIGEILKMYKYKNNSKNIEIQFTVNNLYIRGYRKYHYICTICDIPINNFSMSDTLYFDVKHKKYNIERWR